MRKPFTVRDLDADAVKEYVFCTPSIFRTESENLFFAIADGGNHFTEFGIIEGTLLVFDGELPVENGKLSIYADFSNPKMPRFRMSQIPVQGMDYAGRAIARVNYFES